MPVVHIHMYEGKTVEQKRVMVKAVTEAICQSLRVTPDMVIIQIVDLPKHNVAQGGVLSSDREKTKA